MTHTLKLSDGTTTINLTSNTVSLLLDYEPRTPDITQQEAVSAIVDGGELTAATHRNVTESARCVLVGANGAAVQSTIASINRLFRQAEERQKRKAGAARVYVQVQMDSDSNEYRSEVLSGALVLSDTVWDQWSNSKAEVTLTWTRRFYWEGAEAYVTLRDPVTDTNVTEVEIANHHNGSNRNYVQVVGSSLEGELPTACRIEMENSAGTAVGWNNIYIGHGIWCDALNFDHMLEGEDNETGGGTDTSSASSSGGYYHAKTWTGATTYSAVKYTFTISGTQLEYANGSYFRLLARFAVSPNSTTYVRVEVTLGALSLYQTQEVKLNGFGIEDLGVIQLPPSLYDLDSLTLGDLNLYIYARDTVSGSLSIDYIQLTPLDGWRKLSVIGTSFPDGSKIYDDGMTGIAYTDDAVEGVVGNIVTRGKPIMLWPKRNQRLYILFDEDNGNATIGHLSGIRLAHRPRRLTI